MTKRYNFFTLFLTALALSSATTYAQQHAKSGQTGTSGIFLNNAAAFKIQQWYNPTDLSPFPTSGLITKIYFKSTTANQSGTYTNFELSLKQPNSGTDFGSTTFHTGLTTVFSGASVVLNGAPVANGWFPITLTNPFFYDNTKPLIFEIKFTARNGGISTWASGGTGIKKIYSASPTATTGTNHTTFWQDFGIDLLGHMNNASTSAITEPGINICTGTHPVKAVIKNAGANIINNVMVNWSVNNVVQSPVLYSTPIGLGGSATVTLGNFPFVNPVLNHNIKVWTSMPNGVADPSPLDDEANATRKPLDPPNAVVYFSTNRVCPGDSIFLHAPLDPVYTYIWQKNADPIPGNDTNFLYVRENGFYSVKILNPACSAQSATHQMHIKPAEVELGSDSSMCETVPVQVLDADEPNAVYLWSTGATTKTIPVTESGKYWVKVSLGPYCEASDTVNLEVKPLPVINGISYLTDGATFEFQPGGPQFVDNYLWHFGDGATSTDKSPKHTYTTPGPHNVTLEVFNSCGVRSTSLLAPLNIGNLAAEDDVIGLYPNPVRSTLHIEAKGNASIKEYKLYNAVGSLVGRHNFDSNTRRLTVDVSGYAGGVYTIVVNTGEGKLSRVFQVVK